MGYFVCVKTTIDIPDKALQEAIQHTGAKTKRDAVVIAVDEFNRRRRLEAMAERLHGSCPGFMMQADLDSNEIQARCSVLIEGVDEPLSLADTLEIATNWEDLNKRRARLIEKKAAKQITEEESAELSRLQRLAWAKRQMAMPLPVKELAAIEKALMEKLP